MFRGSSAMELELHDSERPPPRDSTTFTSTSSTPSSTSSMLSLSSMTTLASSSLPSSSSSTTNSNPNNVSTASTTSNGISSASLSTSGANTLASVASTLASRLAAATQPTQRPSAIHRSESGTRLANLSSSNTTMATSRKSSDRMLRSDSSEVLCSAVVISVVDDYDDEDDDDDDDDDDLILPDGSSPGSTGGGGGGGGGGISSSVVSTGTSAAAAAALGSTGLGSSSGDVGSGGISNNSNGGSGGTRQTRRACFTGRTRTTIIACVLFVLIIGFASFKLPVNEWSRDFLQLIPRLGLWGPLVFIVSYALFTVLFLPILPLTLASGVLFGVWFGTVYSWIGAVFGGCVAFILGKQVFAKCALEMAESFPHFAAIDRAISGNSWKIVLFLRLSPLIPFNVMSYILSLTQIGFLSYTGATAAGVLIPTSACVWVGAAASSIADVLANPTRGSVGLLIGGTILSIISLAIITQSSTRAIQYELRKIRDNELPISINDTEPSSPERFSTATRVV